MNWIAPPMILILATGLFSIKTLDAGANKFSVDSKIAHFVGGNGSSDAHYESTFLVLCVLEDNCEQKSRIYRNNNIKSLGGIFLFCQQPVVPRQRKPH